MQRPNPIRLTLPPLLAGLTKTSYCQNLCLFSCLFGYYNTIEGFHLYTARKLTSRTQHQLDLCERAIYDSLIQPKLSPAILFALALHVSFLRTLD